MRIVAGHYFQKWNDNLAKKELWGAVITGAIFATVAIAVDITSNHSRSFPLGSVFLGATIGVPLAHYLAKDDNPHKHYFVTFDTEAGKSYTIKGVTDPQTLEAVIFVIDTDTGEIIESDVELINDGY